MAVGYYGAIATHGGDLGALDSIPGADLNDKDVAVVVTPIDAYLYTLDADSGLAENPPAVIVPDTNPGDKRWIRNLGSDALELPTGANTGDIIRWNAVTGNWESKAEPLEFDHIILTPTDTPPTAVHGGMYFGLSANAMYVGVT